MANGPNMLCPLTFPELFKWFCKERLTNSYRKEFHDGHWNFLFPIMQVKWRDE